MIGQLEGLCTQLPLQCTLTFTGVLSQNTFGYTEVTSVCSSEHYGYWCIRGIGSVSYGSITELVWTVLLQFRLCLLLVWLHHDTDIHFDF